MVNSSRGIADNGPACGTDKSVNDFWMPGAVDPIDTGVLSGRDEARGCIMVGSSVLGKW